jgi:hypothetical protein
MAVGKNKKLGKKRKGGNRKVSVPRARQRARGQRRAPRPACSCWCHGSAGRDRRQSRAVSVVVALPASLLPPAARRSSRRAWACATSDWRLRGDAHAIALCLPADLSSTLLLRHHMLLLDTSPPLDWTLLLRLLDLLARISSSSTRALLRCLHSSTASSHAAVAALLIIVRIICWSSSSHVADRSHLPAAAAGPRLLALHRRPRQCRSFLEKGMV